MEYSEPLIQMHGIGKVYYTDEVETHALSDIELEVKKGEFLSITGPSGCGKSTLLAIAGLLDTPTRGTYHIAGAEVSDLSIAQRARIRNREIGFIFQSFNLIGDLCIAENVELPLRYRSGLSRRERREKALESLERVDMAHRVSHYPSQLSGGQQQRVAVARALVGGPSIILADEPTGNLDSRNGEQVMALLQELNRKGTTICMVTHEPRYAAIASSQVMLLDGKLVDEEELRHRDEREVDGSSIGRHSSAGAEYSAGF
jgi:putative ABC transport system ATP-binding protein